MSDEYFAVILEFNSLEVKIGFAGEAKEHIRLTYEDPLWQFMAKCGTSPTDCPKFLDLKSHALKDEDRKRMLENVCKDNSLKGMMKAYEKDKADAKFFDWSVDRYKALSKLLKMLVYTSLLISLLRTKLLVVDPGLSLEAKYAFCEAIFERGTAVSVSFLPYYECAAIAAGVDDATVLLIQWNTCTLAVVLDLRRVYHEEYQTYSGETLHYRQVAKDQVFDFHRMFDEKFFASESLDSMISGEMGLVEKMAYAIRKLDIDLREKSASNVVICGYVSDIPGLKGRILTELAAALPGYNISGKECLGAWGGASLYCSTSLLKESYANWTHLELTKSNLGKEISKEVGVFSTLI